MLIREGHLNVEEYRANFFQTCIDELVEYYTGKEKESDEEVDDKANIEWLTKQGLK